MTTYSRTERLDAIRTAGFANPLTALAVSLAEFGENRDINSQGQSDARYANGEREQSFGPWQIHLPAHPNVTRSCALDLTCSTGEAFKISQGGTNFGAWSAFTNGAYQRFITEIVKPIADALPSSVPSPSPSPNGGTDGPGSPPPVGPPHFGLSKDIYEKIATALDNVSLDMLTGNKTGAQAAAELRRLFPNVPASTLQAIAYNRGGRIGTEGDDIPGVKGVSGAVDALKNAGSGLDFAKALIAPDNLWRIAFVVLGAALIYGGVRLYFHRDVGSEQPVGAA